MESNKPGFTSIDEYIATFPADIQKVLQEIRATIHNAAPDAQEKISYQMPTFTLNGNLIHFAAFKNHIGLYPTPSATLAFQDEIASYKAAKGSIQLRLDKPMPLDLIRRIVEFRIVESQQKAAKKLSSKKKPTL